MKIRNIFKVVSHLGCFFILLLGNNTAIAQEDKIDIEESAAVFLEDYSDDFQEQFFEGLKQKGIENYDKAINHFLKCKAKEPNNAVVSHELAKVYLLDKQYINAQNYAIEALNNKPENMWYLYTLVKALQLQGNTVSNITKEVPYSNLKLRENLSHIYYNQEKYKEALAVIEKLKRTDKTQVLYSKIKDALKKQESQISSVSYSTSTITKTSNTRDNAAQSYKTRLQGLIRIEAYALVKQISKEALEQYPLQPYFYYAQGLALNQNKKYREALTILEASIDYLIDDISLANKIYKEMANAYTGLHQTSRANMYLRKIKPGF
ncbi:hypothetical protein CLV91_0815 [Maribacter vaceletii]|uniref:Tetratricopeptide repeat protein n=1 Tax=Maribacter vaceletii TaxID=1206816 RepID=A0A495ED58_9FLAO|nr:hypothetical protein [Maribacter vaceletii]RKR14736.1 hypothetical protein CLV91_0815 [Maribacter vaceletii]